MSLSAAAKVIKDQTFMHVDCACRLPMHMETIACSRIAETVAKTIMSTLVLSHWYEG